ncbi:L-lactate dehydrogenase [Streptococcus suis]|uniref:L-lactate dehydrogenase n=1 Tax=Streptococcus suis TaxID=1307 RepID=UPI000CF45F28|nr:L-lactate dehydrogenase [Streptococcus suis]
MARKIGIIGLGHVGATLLHDLVAGNLFDDYVLIDKNEEKLAADILDMEDRVANTGQSATFIANDYSALSDADIIVSSLGKISLQANAANSRFAELPFTSQEVKEVSSKLVASGFSGILIVITNPVDVISQLYQTYTGFPRNRVIGTGTLLDTARMKRAVGHRFGVSPTAISGYNLGEHGNSQFTAWSQVAVAGQPIQALLHQKEMDQLAEEARVGGHTVFFGKGYTNFAIAAAAKTLIEAVLSNSRAVLPVSHYLAAYGTYLGYPATVGRSGIEATVDLDLTQEELTLLDQSATIIRERVEVAKKGDWESLIL